MADIFICYRRNDSEGHAGRLHDHLSERFGARAVFVDVDNLHPGVDFEDVIQRTLRRSTIVLVVIGPRWIDQRLKNESDYVRREIIAALAGKKRIIPVLVGNARMPTRDRLPPELAALAGKNEFPLRHATWKADITRLFASLERILGRKKAAAKSASPAGAKSQGTPRARGQKKALGTASPASTPTKKEPGVNSKRVSKETPRGKKIVEEKPAQPAQRGKQQERKRGAAKTSKTTGAQAPAKRKPRSASDEKAAPPPRKKTVPTRSRTGKSAASTKRQPT